MGTLGISSSWSQRDHSSKSELTLNLTPGLGQTGMASIPHLVPAPFKNPSLQSVPQGSRDMTT